MYQGFFLSSSFFSLLFRQLPAEVAELTSGQMVGSKCCLKMHVWNVGYPFPLQIGPKTTFFPRFCNSRTNLAAYIFGTKHDIHKQPSALQTARGLLHRVKTTWTLVHKWLQIGKEFSPTLRKLCIPLHCQGSQMEISKQNSTKLNQTLPNGKRWTVNLPQNSWGCPSRKKWAPSGNEEKQNFRRVGKNCGQVWSCFFGPKVMLF